MAFQKGQSGNPGGRAKKTAEQLFVEEQCRSAFKTKALPILLAWIESGNESKFKFACEQLAERGFLPHAQSYEVDSAIQIDGMECNPANAKQILGQLISGTAVNGVGASPSGGVGKEESAPGVVDTKREAGGANP